MKKTLIAFTTAVPLALLVGWTANAYPISLRPLSQSGLIEQIGCGGGPSPDSCPYGYRVDWDRWGGWACEPCWTQFREHGDYGPRRYRDDDDRYYEPRRYHDHGNYGPRRYPREY
jgi:hypothetical protein